jgi:hypothetical protein
MIDPWEDVRERADGAYQHKDCELALNDANEDVDCLLADADALLQVVRAAEEIKLRYCGPPIDMPLMLGSPDDAQSLIDALAALPEYLAT